MIITRRKLVTGLSALIVAPAIVRIESLMPVKIWNIDPIFSLAALIVFDKIMTDLERRKLEGYFATTYGLPIGVHNDKVS